MKRTQHAARSTQHAVTLRRSRQSGTGAKYCCFSILALALCGCVGGATKNTDGTARAGVSVQAQTCPACPMKTTQVSDVNGIWNYDSYNGEEDVRPTDGEETTRFRICAWGPPGISLVNCYDVFHRLQPFNYAEPGLPEMWGSIAVDTFFGNVAFAPDADDDGLPDSVEGNVYGTDPNNPDTDGDGLGDGAEVLGWDWVDYPSYGVNPLRKDVLVEVDYEEYEDAAGVVHSWKMSDAVVQKIEQLYAGLDVINPDGSTGIAVHIVHDSKLPQGVPCYERPDPNPGGPIGWLNDGRAPVHPRREAGFQYAALCLGNGSGGGANGAGSRFFVSGPETNSNPADDQTEQRQWAVYALFVHELGHVLGLHHSGGDQKHNCKPNYPSLMNYAFDYDFMSAPQTLAGTLIQFSKGTLPDLDENSLLEKASFPGIAAADLDYLQFSDHFWTTTTDPLGNVMVDWNKDNLYSEAPISAFLRVGSNEGACRVIQANGTISASPLKDYADGALMAEKLAIVIPGAGDETNAGAMMQEERVRERGRRAAERGDERGVQEAFDELMRLQDVRLAAAEEERALATVRKQRELALQGYVPADCERGEP